MARLFIIIALCCVGLYSAAQVPGYMGRKHQFIYTPSVSVFSPQFSVYNNLFVGSFKLNHHVKYEYVLKKNFMIGVFYEHNQSLLKLEQNYPVYDKAYGEYKKHAFGVSFKKYTGRYALAPLGYFIKYQMGLIKYSAVTTRGEINDSYYTQDKETKGYDFAIGMGVGRQFIIARYIPLEIGFDVNIPLKSIQGAFDGYNDLITEAALVQNVGTTMIRLNLGIGILPF